MIGRRVSVGVRVRESVRWRVSTVATRECTRATSEHTAATYEGAAGRRMNPAARYHARARTKRAHLLLHGDPLLSLSLPPPSLHARNSPVFSERLLTSRLAARRPGLPPRASRRRRWPRLVRRRLRCGKLERCAQRLANALPLRVCVRGLGKVLLLLRRGLLAIYNFSKVGGRKLATSRSDVRGQCSSPRRRRIHEGLPRPPADAGRLDRRDEGDDHQPRHGASRHVCLSSTSKKTYSK